MPVEPNRLRLYWRMAVGMNVTAVVIVLIGFTFGGFTSEVSGGFIGAGVVVLVQGIVSTLITIGESAVASRRDDKSQE